MSTPSGTVYPVGGGIARPIRCLNGRILAKVILSNFKVTDVTTPSKPKAPDAAFNNDGVNSGELSFTVSGSNVEIPIKDYEFKDKSNLNNKEVFFGIRPEHIYFKKSNESDFEVTLRADLSEYIGHEQIMTFDYANQEILAKFPSTIKIELVKETKLYFDLTQTSLFDAQTEERI